jgi:hypothetical protein
LPIRVSTQPARAGYADLLLDELRRTISGIVPWYDGVVAPNPLSVECPVCHAAPGDPCRRVDGSRSGQLRTAGHMPRKQAAGRVVRPPDPGYRHAGALLTVKLVRPR